MFYSISENELDSLNLNELIQRMDGLLLQSVRERYGQIQEGFPVSLVSEIISTQRIAVLPDNEKRHIAYLTFSYLVQMQAYSVSSGFANKLLFTPEYDEKNSWVSPAFRLREGAIRQAQIISSRIAMEIFMELLHCIEEGNLIKPGKKNSKIGTFKKWLCSPTNQFHYFAHVLLKAYRFDRGLRSPEIHGTPRLPRRLLMLQTPEHQENNEPLSLINSLSCCWAPLLEILNGKRPSSMQISKDEEEWFRIYMGGNENQIAEKLEIMFQEIY